MNSSNMIMATLCYVSYQGKTLMVHRTKKANDMHAGKWNGLGGKLEPGETPEECARREVYEEAGIRLKSLEFKGIITFPQFVKGEDWYAFIFVGEAESEQVISDSPEGELRWIPDKELLSLNLWEGDKIFIPWLKQAGVFSAKFIYKNGRLSQHRVQFYCQES